MRLIQINEKHIYNIDKLLSIEPCKSGIDFTFGNTASDCGEFLSINPMYNGKKDKEMVYQNIILPLVEEIKKQLLNDTVKLINIPILLKHYGKEV